MQLVLITNELLRKELLSTGLNESAELVWLSDLNDCATYKEAGGFVDLLFDGERERIHYLKGLPGVVIINSVLHTCQETDPSFVRINGWPTFLKSEIMEAAAAKEIRRAAEQVLGVFHKTVEWVDDLPGFIAPRIVSMIIQEAFMALGEGVSSKEEINTAMKLGTAYPYGPFEWADKIGHENIFALLEKLGSLETGYLPSPFLNQQSH
jgi:3-hydroxybutyryl-CoA dehydrogenase